ncbi:serine protease [Streptomyces spinoverrucosus]|uniref:Serine protease n=1 Tax=Streptomyces spinoverrucosus TaxID=284043 RepID=A0A4Y3VRA6_9ACTN|nr:S1 family peptidase [Streptomyces spinoverrucosus]GEC08565.1 serine protease [Streptomyces spinoverrucosus]GHB87770.1 serine protease [Streptomyces spinoverrucosus]
MRNSRKRLTVLTAAVLLSSATVVSGAQAADSTGTRYDTAMISALATSLGVSEQAAVERLDRETTQRNTLSSLERKGVATDGSFFDADGDLVVNADGRQATRELEHAGLRARTVRHGEDELNKVKAELDAAALDRAPVGVSSWEVDLATDTVTVKAHDDGSARAFLRKAGVRGDAVRVVADQQDLVPQATIQPGAEMTFNGFRCSVGFGARDSAGRQYLVTAGHCIEGLPVLSYQGTRFAQGTNTRFAMGSRSVDMGIARLDAGNTISTVVGTYGRAAEPTVLGSQRAVSGATLCKSGRTTFWTCGRVNSYNVTVTYSDPNGGPNTVVTGLASSSVCTQGGDSGGAYISGNQAQGMTSGGPANQRCNGSVNAPGSSYFQPLDDALRHYGLTLNTA